MGALTPLAAAPAIRESFLREGSEIVRQIETRDGRVVKTRLTTTRPGDPEAAFDAAWLRAPATPRADGPARGTVSVVDLFSGCGAMSLGATDALHALGFDVDHRIAVDVFDRALAVYATNFAGVDTRNVSVTDLLDSPLGSPPSPAERALAAAAGEVDLLIGGPPCQGHSDLNNHTRRDDPKNALYLAMARFAEVVGPRAVVIENVPGAVHDRTGVVRRTRDALERLGYAVSARVLDASALGVAQARKRFILVASRAVQPDLAAIATARRPPRTLEWAIDDLLDLESDATFDTPSRHSARNVERIRYLFDHDLHDLPDAERPACHRDKPHSYVSVYGRMHWDRPTQTITTGFGSCGQGRFVHPLLPRTLTPHEAARVQFIPDFFRFGDARRRALQLMIGNAVPPKLAYAVVLDLFA